MRTIAEWLAVALVNSLWQVPLVFCAAWLAARLARPLGVRAEHRVWVVALLLEGVLPFCRFHPSALWPRVLLLLQGAGFGVQRSGTVTAAAGAGQIAGTHWLAGNVLWVLAAVYVMLLLACAARLGVNLWRTRRLFARAEELGPLAKLEEFKRAFKVRSAVRLAWTADTPGPATMGLRRHTVLLPEGFAGEVGEEEMEAVLAHEFAHIERRDFSKNLLYEIAALPVAYHPLLAMTRTQLNETRELVCDARAAEALEGETRYARSLLRLAALLAERTVAGPQPAVGIFDTNIFERRVMQLMSRKTAASAVRRLAGVAGCAVIATVTCLSAVALQADVSAAPAAEKGAPKKISVSAEIMQSNLISKVNPKYPPEAKAAGVDGTVVLAARIGKDGHMLALRVVSGPAMLQMSAMDAVRHWVYKPYLLNGKPVQVDTQINVTYTLADKKKAAPEDKPEEK